MLRPGETIGILGGGQLGRMLALAAARLGLHCHFFAPEAESPAFDVSGARTIAPYDDLGALDRFAAAVAAVTYEFENVPVTTVEYLAARVPVWPNAGALRIAQDRLIEKQTLQRLGIGTATFLPVNEPADLDRAAAAFGHPFLLKTRRFGYDGKGQATIRSASEHAAIFASFQGVPVIAEAMVGFAMESSVIAARGIDGSFRAYQPGENRHEGGLLRRTLNTGTIDSASASAMIAIAERLAVALDYVGVIGVEFFLLEHGDGARILTNEFAPRVHNSGHWTMDGAVTCQFEQHVRAIAGWPLGDTTRVANVEMVNLIGDDMEMWSDFLSDPLARLHLYGKHQARPGRKMGHVNRLLSGLNQ